MACSVRSVILSLACVCQLMGVTAAADRSVPDLRLVPSGVEVVRDLSYVTNGHAKQKLDLYLPKRGDKLPLIVWIHGGGWEAGDKENPRAIILTRDGKYAVASINYRLSKDARFPAQIEDCKSAIRWLRANSAKYRLDPQRIGVIGQSAGGHLSALLGTSGDVKQFDQGDNKQFSSKVQAVCDICGPTDISLYGRSRSDDLLGRLFGGPIQDNRAQVQLANPMAHIGKQIPPFLIIHGDKDPIVPIEHSRLFEQSLKKAGGTVTLRVVAGAQHDPMEQDTPALVTRFFDQHLQPE